MLKESISIKDFGPLVDIQIDEVKKLNVFIGDSGSGKSTVMKLLVLFQWLFKQLCLRSYLKKSGVKEIIREFNFKEYLSNNAIFDYLKDTTEIVYKRGKYTISYKNKRLSNTNINIDDSDLCLEKMTYISDKRNLIPALMADLVPIDKISDFFLHETLEDFKLAIKDFDEVAIPAVDVHVGKRNLKYGKIEFYVKDGGENSPYEIKMEDSSSGMQNIIPLYLIISFFATKFNLAESAKNTIKKYMFDTDLMEQLSQFSPSFNLADIANKNIHIHIEEPELSLFPDGQIKLMESLIDVCYKKNTSHDISMIVSTHSPYIMNYLNLAIKKGGLKFADIGAYQIKDGMLFSLMRQNNGIVDTRSLSDPISRIYEEFNL